MKNTTKWIKLNEHFKNKFLRDSTRYNLETKQYIFEKISPYIEHHDYSFTEKQIKSIDMRMLDACECIESEKEVDQDKYIDICERMVLLIITLGEANYRLTEGKEKITSVEVWK